MTAKIQKSSIFFRGPRVVVLSTQCVQNLPKITLPLTVLRQKTFSTFAKIQDGGQNLEKSKFFRGPRVVISTQEVQYLPKITLSLTVIEISNIFHFH